MCNKMQEQRRDLNIEFIIKRQAEDEDLDPSSLVM